MPGHGDESLIHLIPCSQQSVQQSRCQHRLKCNDNGTYMLFGCMEYYISAQMLALLTITKAWFKIRQVSVARHILDTILRKERWYLCLWLWPPIAQLLAWQVLTFSAISLLSVFLILLSSSTNSTIVLYSSWSFFLFATNNSLLSSSWSKQTEATQTVRW